MTDKKLETLKRQHEHIFNSQGWQDFRTYRRDHWDPLIRRRSPQTLSPTAASFLQATNAQVDIQSPDLEKDLHDRVAVLLSNTVKVDAYSLDQAPKAKDDVEDVRISLAGSLAKQNNGFELSRHIYESMVRYGAACVRKTWHEPDEPDDTKLTDYMPKGAKSDQAKLKARERYFEEQEADCFSWVPVSMMEVAWFPLRKPEVYFQESVVAYEEAKELRDRDGRKLRLTQENKAVFMDEGGEEENEGDWQGKKIHVIVRAMLDKESGKWQVTEWVREASQRVEESAQMDEYTCPFKHSPFFHIAGGDELVTENNPHLRYRPMLYPLIVDMQELNALVTLLVMTTVWHLQNPFYVAWERVSPEQWSAIDGLEMQGLGVIEGSGAQRKFLFRMPEPNSGEIATAPRLEAMPNKDLPDAFMLRIQQVQANIEYHRSNRYLTGEAFASTTEQPATSTLNQAEAAATPFGPYHTKADRFWEEWLRAELDAIICWDEMSETGKPYPYRTRGNEPVTREPRDAGEMVVLTADKARRPLTITALTRNETQAERAMNDQLADIAYEKGAIEEEEWHRRRGAEDPRKRMEALWKDRQNRQAEGLFQPVIDESLRTLFLALTGLNTLKAPGAASQMPQLPAGQPGMGAPTQQPGLGVMNGTAPLVNGPAGGANPVRGGV